MYHLAYHYAEVFMHGTILFMDKAKYSKAAKERWAKLTPEERSKRASILAAKRWSKASRADRQKQYKAMMSGQLSKQSK